MTYWRFCLIGHNVSVVVEATASIGQPVGYQTIAKRGEMEGRTRHQLLEESLNRFLLNAIDTPINVLLTLWRCKALLSKRECLGLGAFHSCTR